MAAMLAFWVFARYHQEIATVGHRCERNRGRAVDRPPARSIPPQLAALQALRLRIDEQDLKILRAIEERGRIVEEVLVLKQSAGFRRSTRFASASCCSACRPLYRGPYQWQDVEHVFRTLLEMSRTLPVPTPTR